ncbi:MAG: DNA topoisomerase, partial [Thermoanaerobaculum sp.]|nr:DNA topoisomerase [Thermoanaerobaculum sp.]
QYAGDKIEQFSITDEARASEVRSALEAAAQGWLTVEQVEHKQRKRHPAPPFITSTLQQEAARKLGFSAQRTMRLAQQLYEGVDIGSGSVGLITYMRTDSVNLAQEAIAEIRNYIAERYGRDALPQDPRQYKTKAKNAQEAHEAIRPTSIYRDPAALKAHLTADQYKLYELIWKRTLACQMASALINQVVVDLSAGQGNLFRATGSVVADPGFMRVYLEGRDDGQSADDDEE